MFIGEEKEVVVDDVVGGVSNGRNERKEEDSHKRSREIPIGQHLRTKAEALEYLADLSHYPNLANWLAAEARENEARKLRRNWKRKRDGQVVDIGTPEVSAPENGANRIGVPEEHLETDASLESEDEKLQKRQKVSEGSAPIWKDSVSESETAMAQQPYFGDSGKGENGGSSSFKERTEPTNHENVQEEFVSLIDFHFSTAEEIDLSKEGDQVENNTDPERTIPSETDRKEKKANLIEGAVLLEAQQMDGNDVIPIKLISSPRYLDTQDSTEPTNNSSGEDDDNIHLQNKKEKPKVCSICGHLGHKWKKCKKVNRCLYCMKKGHLPQDCPREDIVRERTNFCLKCVNSGHSMFSCTNDYPAGDLENIQCYVCKAFGHLCCAKYENEGPILLSCYNCGESGHQGPQCNKVQQRESRSKRRKNRKKRKKLQEDNGSPSASVHSNSRDKGHPGQECHKKVKLVS